jgi:hypothetical protein
VAYPAASNEVCSRHRSCYNGVVQNQVFSYAYMLLFLPGLPDFQHSFYNIGNCSILHGSNVTAITPQFTTLRLFLISGYFLKICLTVMLLIIA